MSDRPLHFRALDRLAVMGNRSYLNPLLSKSYELFLAPFGISPNYVELSLVGCAVGEFPPLYLHTPRFRPSLVRQLGSQIALFQPILDAGAAADVAVLNGPRLCVKTRHNVENGDLYAEALAVALAQGLEASINAALAQAEEYFRGYLAAAVRVLADPETDAEMLQLFLERPEEFAVRFVDQLSSASPPATVGSTA